MKFSVVVTLTAFGLVAAPLAATTASAAPASSSVLARYGHARHSHKAKAAGEPGRLKKHIAVAPRGLRWGMSNEQIARLYDKIFDKEFVPLYKKVEPGPRMTALDVELKNKKAILRRSLIGFNDTPTGLDQSPLAGEFTYGNHESMSRVTLRSGTARHFFFFSDRLWKIYDEHKLRKGGPLGDSYKEAVAILTKKFGVAPKMIPADFSKHQYYDEAIWFDNSTLIRAVNREAQHVLAMVYEDKNVADGLARYRTHKKKNPNSIDSSVLAVTKPATPPPDDKAKDSKKKRRRGH
jgi:hypothetical protein